MIAMLHHESYKIRKQALMQKIEEETWTAYCLRFLLVPLFSLLALFTMAGCLALLYGALYLFL